jgi:toxin ParE1/3/4
MVKYHIKLYPRAYRDMEEIYRYIAIEKQVPENAKAQTDRIWRAIKKTGDFSRFTSG